MTIGEGIFWSTLIVIVFFSIVLLSKYKRWRTFIKVLTILAALGAAIGAGVWFHNKYVNRPQIMSSLNGIRLGMSEVNVTLQAGKPDDISELDPTPGGFRKVMIYRGSRDSYT